MHFSPSKTSSTPQSSGFFVCVVPWMHIPDSVSRMKFDGHWQIFETFSKDGKHSHLSSSTFNVWFSSLLHLLSGVYVLTDEFTHEEVIGLKTKPIPHWIQDWAFKHCKQLRIQEIQRLSFLNDPVVHLKQSPEGNFTLKLSQIHDPSSNASFYLQSEGVSTSHFWVV